MKGNCRENEMRVELKYCEHCGGLWVREGGAGVYCEKCQPKIADLPIPKRQRRPKLPVGSEPVTLATMVAPPVLTNVPPV